jgi:hypothetical protein
MMNCDDLQDRMPAVAAGRDQWSDGEQAHVNGCGECAAAWRLVSAASQLGRDITPGIDPAMMTRAVLERVRLAEQASRRRRISAWTVGGAALATAAALLLTVVRRPETASPPTAAPIVASTQVATTDVASAEGATTEVAVALPLAELSDVGATELEEVLTEFEEPLGAKAATAPELEGLDATQLENALRSWEES